jgi:hypothetical protein
MTGTSSSFYCTPEGLRTDASVETRMHFYRFLNPLNGFRVLVFRASGSQPITTLHIVNKNGLCSSMSGNISFAFRLTINSVRQLDQVLSDSWPRLSGPFSSKVSQIAGENKTNAWSLSLQNGLQNRWSDALRLWKHTFLTGDASYIHTAYAWTQRDISSLVQAICSVGP